MTLFAAMIALVLPAASSDERADPGCQTDRCEARVAKRAQRRHWRQVVRPHRAWLRRVAACESGGRWTINTGNGYSGAYQFTPSSWVAVGGRGFAHQASRLEQSYRAVRLLQIQGPGAWPICGR